MIFIDSIPIADILIKQFIFPQQLSHRCDITGIPIAYVIIEIGSFKQANHISDLPGKNTIGTVTKCIGDAVFCEFTELVCDGTI